MYQDIDTTDRINVLLRAGIKVLRGLVRRPFLKEVHGLLLIGRKVQISQGKQIRCGRNVKFEDYAEIQGLSRDGLSFGDNVTIGRGVMIRPSSYYGKDLGAGLSMGDNSSIGPYAYVGCAGKIVIGTNVMFGPFCRLFAENHFFTDTERTIKSQGVWQQGIVVEDDCWIGGDVTILDGVTIGKGSVIGAGTLVTASVPPGSILTDKRSPVVRQRTVSRQHGTEDR